MHKLSISVITLGAALSLWSLYEPQTQETEQANQSPTQDKFLQGLNQLGPDEDILIARQTAPTIKTPHKIQETSTSSTYKTTQDYEANSRYGSLPSHMADIAIEQFTLDSQGQLILNEKIKNIIEYFLMASHIEGREQAVARIQEYIDMSLPTEAASQAMQITENYLLYKNNYNTEQLSMSTDFTQQENLDMLRSALSDKKQSRRHYLGEAASEALFGYEERYDDFSYQRLAINSDTSLSEEEKDQLMAQAENQLPSDMAQTMRDKREEQKLTSRVNKLKSQSGSEQEIYTLRSNFYGEKVAKRMRYLESNTPEWQARVTGFYQQQQDILASTDLSDEAKQLALKEAKDNAFTRKEQVKLAVQSIRGSVANL